MRKARIRRLQVSTPTARLRLRWLRVSWPHTVCGSQVHAARLVALSSTRAATARARLCGGGSGRDGDERRGGRRDVVVVDQPLRGAVREAAALRIQHAAKKSAAGRAAAAQAAAAEL